MPVPTARPQGHHGSVITLPTEVDPGLGPEARGRVLWQASCSCGWVHPTPHTRDTNARRALARHKTEAAQE